MRSLTDVLLRISNIFIIPRFLLSVTVKNKFGQYSERYGTKFDAFNDSQPNFDTESKYLEENG